MTPETNIAFRSQPSTSAHLTEAHLTEIQFGELLASSAWTAGSGRSPAEAEAEEHLLACEQCAAELAGLRGSLSLFRQASTAYSDDQLRRLPPMPLPARPMLSPALQPAYLVAAAALVLAAFLPMQVLRQRAPQAAAPANTSATVSVEAPSNESDEALLNDIDHEVSASVPAPMQALADPAPDTDISAQTLTQRKD